MTLLIFDCDGVLVDSEVIAHQTLLDVLVPLGFTMTLEESFSVFAGRSLKDTLMVIERQLGRALPDDILNQSRDLLFHRFRAGLKPIDGVQRRHRGIALSSLLRLVVGARPAPSRTRGERPREPAHCIVIEDSTLGIEAGLAAGTQAVGFAGGSHATDALAQQLSDAGAHHVIRAMHELPPCVEALKVREC